MIDLGSKLTVFYTVRTLASTNLSITNPAMMDEESAKEAETPVSKSGLTGNEETAKTAEMQFLSLTRL